MNAETLQALKDRLDAETYAILCDDADSIRARAAKKTRADRIAAQARSCENAKMKLYDAISSAETHPTKERLIHAAKVAAALDDFVTALYWHKKAKLAPIDADERFYRLKLSVLAAAQSKQAPAAQPILSSAAMLQDTELAKKLEDEAYLALETECKVLENEYYKKELGTVAETVLAPRQAKFKKEENAGCMRTGITWLLGIIWLIYSTPKVWTWADNFFSNHLGLLFLFFWVVPVAYVIAVLFGIFMLGESAWGSKSDKMSKDLDTSVGYYVDAVKQKLSQTEQYAKRREMDAGIPEAFCNYDSRLFLAFLSRIYGEERLEKVVKLPEKKLHSSWLTAFAGEKQAGEHPYEKVIFALLDKSEDLESIFLANELAKKERAAKDNVTLNRYDAEITDFHLYAPYYEKGESFTALRYAFLAEELRVGEEANDAERLGAAYYLLYILSGGKDYAAGEKAIEYKNPRMIRSAMEAAIRGWTRSSFGYSRYQAQKYIESLEKAGDPEGAKLRELLKEQLESEERQRVQDATIERKEREQAEREAIYKRWQAESKADAVEREVNMYLHGDYSTEFERMASGKMSYTDYSYSEEWRKKFMEHQE